MKHHLTSQAHTLASILSLTLGLMAPSLARADDNTDGTTKTSKQALEADLNKGFHLSTPSGAAKLQLAGVAQTRLEIRQAQDDSTVATFSVPIMRPLLRGSLGAPWLQIFIQPELAQAQPRLLDMALSFELHEALKLRIGQWLSLGLAVIAVVVLAVGLGSIPVISLTLAFSFGFYGFVKNRMGPSVKSLDSLTSETLWLFPVAIGLLVYVSLGTGLSLGTLGGVHTALLLSAGAVTSIPLLFFGAAARRLPLSIMGLMQYLAPVMQFLFGVVIMGEPMPLERWIGFALVWIALVILSIDALRHRRNRLPVVENP